MFCYTKAKGELKMIKRGLALVALGALLVGCQPIAFEPEDYEPVSSFVTNTATDEVEETENVELPISSIATLNSAPRELQLHVGNTSIYSPTVNYCWETDTYECSEEMSENPTEFLAAVPIPPAAVAPNTELVYALKNDGNASFPFPSSMQLYLHEGETLTPVGEPITDTQNPKITLETPSEQGVYVYVLIAIYEGELTGITHYAFRVQVE